MTQFGRALHALNIDIICANSSQAKGRVERANATLQDRLVKEMRLLGISSMEAGNAFLPVFMADYNARFAKPPFGDRDLHRSCADHDEFSAVGGFTYNFTNPATNYQNGVDFHLDMAASQFLSKQFFVGAVGYVYDQVSADRGSAPILGPIESRVAGIGPQAGYIFPLGNMQGVLNVKAYFEFDNHDRPDGWNTWVTFSISPPAPPAPIPPTSRSAMIYK